MGELFKEHSVQCLLVTMLKGKLLTQTPSSVKSLSWQDLTMSGVEEPSTKAMCDKKKLLLPCPRPSSVNGRQQIVSLDQNSGENKWGTTSAAPFKRVIESSSNLKASLKCCVYTSKFTRKNSFWRGTLLCEELHNRKVPFWIILLKSFYKVTRVAVENLSLTLE